MGISREPDMYAGRKTGPWCRKCKHELTPWEYKLYKRRLERRKFWTKVVLWVVGGGSVLGVGWVMGVSLKGSSYDQHDWFGNWASGTLIVGICLLLPLVMANLLSKSDE